MYLSQILAPLIADFDTIRFTNNQWYVVSKSQYTADMHAIFNHEFAACAN